MREVWNEGEFFYLQLTNHLSMHLQGRLSCCITAPDEDENDAPSSSSSLYEGARGKKLPSLAKGVRGI